MNDSNFTWNHNCRKPWEVETTLSWKRWARGYTIYFVQRGSCWMKPYIWILTIWMKLNGRSTKPRWAYITTSHLWKMHCYIWYYSYRGFWGYCSKTILITNQRIFVRPNRNVEVSSPWIDKHLAFTMSWEAPRFLFGIFRWLLWRKN